MKEIKPFFVETSKFSKEEIIEIHRISVESGALNKEGPEGSSLSAPGMRTYTISYYCYFGVNRFNRTFFSDNTHIFAHTKLCSMEEVYNHLGIKKEKPTMNNKNNSISSKQQPTKQTPKQLKSSNKGQKVLPKSSSLLKFVYNQSEYVVRGVTNFNIELENGKLFLKYSYHRKHQTGETSGTDKVLILNDLEKIVSLVPSQTHPDKYNHKVVLNLVP